MKIILALLASCFTTSEAFAAPDDVYELDFDIRAEQVHVDRNGTDVGTFHCDLTPKGIDGSGTHGFFSDCQDGVYRLFVGFNMHTGTVPFAVFSIVADTYHLKCGYQRQGLEEALKCISAERPAYADFFGHDDTGVGNNYEFMIRYTSEECPSMQVFLNYYDQYRYLGSGDAGPMYAFIKIKTENQDGPAEWSRFIRIFNAERSSSYHGSVCTGIPSDVRVKEVYVGFANRDKTVWDSNRGLNYRVTPEAQRADGR